MEGKLQRKKTKAERENNPQVLVSACADLADIYKKRGQFDLAIKEYQVIAKVNKQNKKFIEYATANRGIGEAYMSLHNFEKALEYHQIYLEIAIREKDELEKQRALATLGHTYLTCYMETQNNLEVNLNSAYKYFMKSLLAAEKLSGISKLEKEDMKARLFSNLGLVKDCLGEYDKALELLERSVAICKQNDIYEQLTRGYLSLASLYEKMNDSAKSIQQYNLAVESAKKLRKNVDLMCSALQAKSEALIKLADFHGAKQDLLKAYKLKTPNLEERKTIEKNLRIVACMCYTEDKLIASGDSKDLKKLYETMGDGACSLKNYKKAIEYYELRLKYAEKSGVSNKELASCYYSLAETYKDNGQYDQAVDYYYKELALCVNLKDSLNTLSKIVDAKEEAKASKAEIASIYETAFIKCRESNNLKEERMMVKRYIAYLQRNGFDEDASQLEQHLDTLGCTPSDYESSDPESEESESQVLGGDINLSNLTDNNSEDSDIENQTTNTSYSAVGKRRKKNYTIKKNGKGETQLHVACINGNLKLTQHLLEQGHPVNVRDHCGWLPLHEACNYGHYDIVKMLIDKGASINDRGGTGCNGVTPLYDAAQSGHLEIVELLLDKGASVTVKTDDGDTPLNALNALKTKHSFDGEELSLCNSLIERMAKMMEKTGHKVNQSTYTHRVNSFENQQKHSLASSSRNDRSFALKDFDDNEDVYADTTASEPSGEIAEYQRVMTSLKRKSTENLNKGKSVDKQPALVDDTEVSIDDWLEDDLGHVKTKKRKINPFDVSGGITSSSSEVGMSETKRSSISPKKKPHTMTKRSSGEYWELDHDVVESTIIEMPPKKKSPNIPKSFSKKKKKQTSLVNAGFRRCYSDTPNSSSNKNPSFKKNISFDLPKTKQKKLTNFQQTRNFPDPDSTTSPETEETETTETETSVSLSTCPSQTTSAVPAPSTGDLMVYVDVSIEGQVFRIPVKLSQVQTNTIGWLAEQASHKYARKNTTKPKLELETNSGALLSDEDPLGLLFPLGALQAEPVVGKIVQISLAPIIDRYKEACKETSTDPHNNLCTLLEEMSISLNLHKSFAPKSLLPVLKALNHQSTLFELDISGNFLDIDCIKQLCSTLPSLLNLTSLNLRCTGLSYNHLAELAKMFSLSSSPILQNLINLNLGDSNLGNGSLKYLSQITKNLALTHLDLSNVKFTENLLRDFPNEKIELNLQKIQDLNISNNSLTSKDIKIILDWTDISNVRTLNISRNGLNHNILTSITDCLKDCNNGGELLENVHLSRCSIADNELYQLLMLCTSLRTIDLSYNSNLTGISLRRLLEYPTLEHINLIGCDSILKYLSEFECAYDLFRDSDNTKGKLIKISGNFDNYSAYFKILKDKFLKQFSNGYLEEDDRFLLLSKT